MRLLNFKKKKFINSTLLSTKLLFVCLFIVAVPTKSPPQENTIGTNEVKVPFVNKATLSSGKPVT